MPVLVNLSVVDRRLRKLRDAHVNMERALVIYEAAYGPDRRDVMKALVKQGIVRRGKITNYFISLAFKRQRKVKSGRWQFDRRLSQGGHVPDPR